MSRPQETVTLNVTALHEAAHAVVAALLRVPFTRVTIKPKAMDDGWADGRVMLRKVTERSYARFVRSGDGYRSRSVEEIQQIAMKADRGLVIRSAIVALAARLEVERRQTPDQINKSEADYTKDEALLRSYAKQLNLNDNEFDAWRSSILKRADELLQIPYVAAAVLSTTLDLQCQKTLSAKVVRDNLRFSKQWHENQKAA